MENASKALLIAAAVLVVVLLVVFGVGIFDQAEKAGDTSNVSTEVLAGISSAANKFNSILNRDELITKIEAQMNKMMRGNQLRLLLEEIEEYNAGKTSTTEMIGYYFSYNLATPDFVDNNANYSLKEYSEDNGGYYYEYESRKIL